MDALIFLYIDTALSNALSIGPIGVGETKYSSVLRLEVYQPNTNSNIMRVNLNTIFNSA